MRTRVLSLVLVSLFLVSCGGKKGETKSVKEEVVSEKKIEQNTSNEVKLEISGTDQMKFNKKELKVKVGQKITLTLKHDGRLPIAAMGHNWVLLKQGTNIVKFSGEAMAAKATDYIPEGDSVIAHTKLVGGGDSTTVTFEAPAKGTYDFICSFPGHYGMMKGKFIVE